VKFPTQPSTSVLTTNNAPRTPKQRKDLQVFDEQIQNKPQWMLKATPSYSSKCGVAAFAGSTTEILRLYAYLRPAPVTIPEMRLDLFGLRLHLANQQEIVKGGFHFRTPEPRKSTTD
jgi:hypothetical protein